MPPLQGNPPLCLFLRLCLFKMEGPFIETGRVRVCPHNAALSPGHCSATVQPETASSAAQRELNPGVYRILILTGFNISTMFTVAPGL